MNYQDQSLGKPDHKKKLYFILIPTLVYFFGCVRNTNSYLTNFSYNDSTCLEFHIKNCYAPEKLIITYNLLFPPEQITLEILFQKDTIEILKLKISHPITLTLFRKASYASCFSLPGDTLKVLIDLSTTNELKDNISFKGKTASISTYLTRGKLEMSYTPYRFETVDDYNRRINGLTIKRISALHAFNYRKILPRWFVKMEELDIKYTGAGEKIFQYKIRNRLNFRYKAMQPDYIKKLGVKLDNPHAMFSSSYYSLLCNISTIRFYKYLGYQNVSSEVLYNYVKENIDFAKKYLHSETREIFIAQRICVLLSRTAINNAISSNDSLYFQKIDTLINYVKSEFKDSDLKNALFAYQKSQLSISN